MTPSWFGSNPVKEDAAPQLVDPQPNTKPDTQNVSPTSVAMDPSAKSISKPLASSNNNQGVDSDNGEKKEAIEAKQKKNMTLFSRFFRDCYAPELPDESKDLKSKEQISNERREMATEEVVAHMMKGWDITEKPCSVCGIPLMNSPDKLHTECPICGPAGSKEKSNLLGMQLAQGATSNVASSTQTQPKSSKLSDQNLNNIAGQVSDKPTPMTLSLDLPSDFDFSNSVAVEGLLKHLQTKQTNAVVGRGMSSHLSSGPANKTTPKPSASSRQNFSQPFNTRQSGAPVFTPSPYATGNLQYTRIPPSHQFTNPPPQQQVPPQQFVNPPPQHSGNAPPQQFAQPAVQSHHNTMYGYSQDDGSTHMREGLMNTLTLQLEAANQKLVNPKGSTLAEQIKNQQVTYATGNLQYTRIPPSHQFTNPPPQQLVPPQQFVNPPPQYSGNAPPQQFAQPAVQSHHNTMYGYSQDDGSTHMGEDLMNTLTLQLEAANQKLVNPKGSTLAEQIKNQQETVDLIKQLSTTMEKLNKMETLNKI